MMKISFVLLCLALLGACSGGGGNGPGPAMEPLLDGLSEEHLSRLEIWKKSVLKTCDAHAVFSEGSQSSGKLGVDIGVLLEQNGNSFVFKDQEQISVVTGVDRFSGHGSSQIHQSYSADRRNYAFNAETRYEGSNCTLFVNGKQVYETFIGRSLELGLGFADGRELKASSTQLSQHSQNGKILVRSGAVSRVLETALRSSSKVHSFWAQKLRTTPEVAQRLVNSRGTMNEIMVRPLGTDSAVWTSLDEKKFIGSGPALDRLVSGTGDFSVELRVPIQLLSMGGFSNKVDAGVLSLEIDISLSKSDTDFEANIVGQRSTGIKPYDAAQAQSCVVGRFDALLKVSRERLEPSMQDAAGACRIFNPKSLALDGPLVKAFIPQILKGVQPTSKFDYAGWDQAISELAVSMAESGEDLQSLDPSSETIIVSRLADNLNSLRNELQSLSLNQPSRRSLYSLGAAWAFNDQSVSHPRIQLIVSALERSIETFPTSASWLLNGLETHPNDFDEVLHFSAAISDTYRTLALRGANLSTALGSREYFREVFDAILQKKVSESTLRGWVDSLSEINEIMRRNPGIGQSKGALTELALKWRRSSEATKEEVEKVFSAIGKVEGALPESTQELVKSLGNSFAQSSEAVDFALTVTPAYVTLLQRVVNEARAQDMKGWGDVRWSRVLQERPTQQQLRRWDEFFIEAKAFTLREQQRTRDDWSSSNERNRKEVLSIGLEESWGREDFALFEAAASVATYRSVCSHRKGLSSFADCAGLRKFSKKAGMLLDPAFAGRYLGTSKIFSNFLSRTTQNFSLSLSLMSEFFEPIWNRCENSVFAQRSAELARLLDAAIKDPNGSGSFERDRAIRELIRNCR